MESRQRHTSRRSTLDVCGKHRRLAWSKVLQGSFSWLPLFWGEWSISRPICQMINYDPVGTCMTNQWQSMIKIRQINWLISICNIVAQSIGKREAGYRLLSRQVVSSKRFILFKAKRLFIKYTYDYSSCLFIGGKDFDVTTLSTCCQRSFVSKTTVL